jgi:4-carboxymuconolactone decarboxylase
VGWPRAAAEETALMLMLHAGYPAALEGLRVLNEAWPGRAGRTREGGVAAWRRRGERLCHRVYGPVFPRLMRSVRALHPDLAVWMVEQGYGRVLSRPQLAAAPRELVAVAVLAAGGWPRQLHSHLLGAGRCGASRAAIRAAFTAGRGAAGSRGQAACDRAWRAAFDPPRGET